MIKHFFKKQTIFSKIISLILIIPFVFSTQIKADSFAPNQEQGYTINILPDYSTEYINYMDGYSLKIPFSSTIELDHNKNISYLKSTQQNIQVNIMRQKFTTAQSDNNVIYRNYSHRFLNNKLDHHTLRNEVITYKGKTLHLTEWYRKNLSKVPNDKNYYYYFDYVISAKDILTIHCKSDSPLQLSTWLWMIDSIQLFNPTMPKVITPTEKPKNRKWAKVTEDFYNKYFSDNADLAWGFFSPQYPYYSPALNLVEQEVGYRFPIILDYYGFTKVSKHAAQRAFATAKAENRVMEYTVQPPLDATGENYVYRLLNGELDTELQDIADAIVAQEHPVLFRFFNEMNGDWCSYSAFHTGLDADIYQAAYRYVYDLFEQRGANQYAIWIWNPNHRSFPNYVWNNEMAYYPGDEYVDIIGLTAYNTGNYYPGENWQSFAQLYDNIYTYAEKAFKQPLMITEFASSTFGGDKVSWTKDMLSQIENKSKIKVAIWWDGADKDAKGNEARIYYINRPKENAEVFRHYFKNKEHHIPTKPDKNSRYFKDDAN